MTGGFHDVPVDEKLRNVLNRNIPTVACVIHDSDVDGLSGQINLIVFPPEIRKEGRHA